MSRTQFTVVKGSIVSQTDCDGIVNSANANFRVGSGVCGAIYATAGPRLEPYSTKFSPLQIGEALAAATASQESDKTDKSISTAE